MAIPVIDLSNVIKWFGGSGAGTAASPYALSVGAGQLPLTPVGAHTVNSSLSSAVTLTAPAGANALLIQALVQNVRFTLDGTTPTASIGFQMPAGNPAVIIDLSATTVVKVIQETSGAIIQYQFGTV